jgi:signal-transduction protein with cAMP-binding, CBS, and nucleotidyltransferase domain
MVATRNVTNVSVPPSASQDRNGRRKSPTTDLREVHDAGRLREFPAFDNFSDHELLRLVRAARHESKSTPWPLIHEHTPSDACYILLSGEVGVYVGRDRVATLGPGEVIGESALRHGKLRSATVTTTGPAEVLRIDRDDLTELLDDMPALRGTIEATVARHVPVVPAGARTEPEPKRCKVNASVPTDVVRRFEQAAHTAGVNVAAALEDALTRWIERNSGGDHG